MGVHGSLYRAKSINSHVRRHLDRRAINGDAEVDDARILLAAERLRLQSGGSDVGDGIPWRAPRGRRTPLPSWGGRRLTNAAREHKQRGEHCRQPGVRAPPTAWHASRIERGTFSPALQRAAGYSYAGTLPFGPQLCSGSQRLAPVAQGIEHRPPEAGAQVRILPGAPVLYLVSDIIAQALSGLR